MRGIGSFVIRVAGASILTLAAPLAVAYELPEAQAHHYSAEVDLLQRMSKGIAEISTEAKKAIVFISTSKTIKNNPFAGQVNPFEFFFGPMPYRHGPEADHKEKALGSGFIVDLKKGYVLTNNHVIDEADEITVKLANDESYPGKVLGRDKNTDIAIVQIKSDKFKRDGVAELTLGDSDKVQVGEFVIAVGAPFGLEASLSFGILSAAQRGNLQITNLGNFLQTDAAINPGNSGGPLLDTKGQVVGMNTAIFSRSGGSAGIGFAVPSSLIRRVVPQLIEQGHLNRGFLGVRLTQELDEDINSGLGLGSDAKGALVSYVQVGTPAHKAGLQAGDVIVSVEGKKVTTNSDLTNAVGLLPPGQKIKVEYLRDGKKNETEVKLSAYPDEQVASGDSDADKDELGGLRLTKLTPANVGKMHERFDFESDRGLLIVDIVAGSRAEEAGFRPGDVLLKINRKPLTSVEDLKKIYSKSKKVLIQLERKGNYIFAAL